MAQTLDSLPMPPHLPGVRRISVTHLARWLQAGIDDMLANPIASIAYGLLFAIGGDLLLLALWGSPWLFAIAVSGFLLLAPILSAGLYEISRRQERGLPSTFIDSLTGLRRARESLALFGLVLTLVALAWAYLTALFFALLGISALPSVSALTAQLTDPAYWPLLLGWVVTGACLALLVFALGIVTAPLLLDRDHDLIAAMQVSLAAFAANPGALLAWAGLIVLFTAIGFASLLFGLILIMPLLGHASWHAYRDLVE